MCPVYGTGMTLRFPRINAIRDPADKAWDGVNTVADLQQAVRAVRLVGPPLQVPSVPASVLCQKCDRSRCWRCPLSRAMSSSELACHCFNCAISLQARDQLRSCAVEWRTGSCRSGGGRAKKRRLPASAPPSGPHCGTHRCWPEDLHGAHQYQ